MSEKHQSKAVVLVIDDEPQALTEVADTLLRAGYQAVGCPQPEASLDLARRIQPDLIVSDIHLGDHSGLELCRCIREDEALADMPVLFLSGAQIPNVVQQAHAAGGTYYLRKPFDPQVLLELVDKALWMPHLIGHQMRQREMPPAPHESFSRARSALRGWQAV